MPAADREVGAFPSAGDLRPGTRAHTGGARRASGAVLVTHAAVPDVGRGIDALPAAADLAGRARAHASHAGRAGGALIAARPAVVHVGVERPGQAARHGANGVHAFRRARGTRAGARADGTRS